MLDWRSAGQFLGLMLVARLLAYLIIRLIERVRPRPIHFMINAAIGQRLEMPSVAKKSKRSGKDPEAGQKLIRILKRKFDDCCFTFMAIVRFRAREVRRRVTLKVITEIIGLLTAALSLAALVLECFFK